jgi:hypothetical protein
MNTQEFNPATHPFHWYSKLYVKFNSLIHKWGYRINRCWIQPLLNFHKQLVETSFRMQLGMMNICQLGLNS